MAISLVKFQYSVKYCYYLKAAKCALYGIDQWGKCHP